MIDRLYKALILDMDGVITDTARLHAKAWKTVFDEFQEHYRSKTSRNIDNFDITTDYQIYFDGQPRLNGIQNYLQAKGIDIPLGDPESPPNLDSMHGIANRKNEIFQQILQQDQPEVFEDTIEKIKEARDKGLKLAAISSSKNCKAILEHCAIIELFDVVIDGLLAEKMQLRPKPSPDIFLEASRALGVSPKDAIIVEDAIAGVQAGREGGFAKVYGLSRKGGAKNLLQHGAHQLIHSAREIKLAAEQSKVPLAMEHLEQIKAAFVRSKPFIFFDYDGTLTPIVSHPDEAVLADKTRQLLKSLAEIYPIAVISGRGLTDVRDKVKIDKIYYAGSHGFEIMTASGEYLVKSEAKAALTPIKELSQKLDKLIERYPGCILEKKRFSVAVHFRNLATDNEDSLIIEVRKMVQPYSELRILVGKKVLEIQADIDWNKGKALLHILDQSDLSKDECLPVYFGDNTTDEDAFQELLSLDGIGFKVSEKDCQTKASYRLRSVFEVSVLIEQIINWSSN